MSWLDNVLECRKKGSFEGAMAILRAELSARPNDPEVFYQIAWTHDALGKERDAVPAYEKAIELGLEGHDLRSAYLGLGSTFRTLGEYQKSNDVFKKAIKLFPDYEPLKTFHALTLYNLNQPERCIEILLHQLVETTRDPSIKSYERALLFYSDKLNEVFE